MQQPLLSQATRICVVLCVLNILAMAQGGNRSDAGLGASSGAGRTSHVIRGKIFIPSGQLPEHRMRVTLEVSTGGIYAETFSDSVGNFEFRSVPNNNYRVVVPGDNLTFETAMENLEVSGAMSRTFTAQLYLRGKENPTNTSSHKMVSAAEFSQEVPKAAKKSYEQGLKKIKDGKPDDAITHLQEALRLFPDYVLALTKLGETQAAQSKTAEAEATFQRALAISPKYPLTHISLGLLLVHLKRYPEAIEHLETANNLDEGFPMAHLNLGIALMERTPQGATDTEHAEREFRKAIMQGGPQMANANKLLYNLYLRQHDYPKAIAALEAYLKDAPNAPDLPQVQATIAKLKKTTKLQPPNPQQP